jgi:PAS domain S-box-containing protein
MITGRLKKEMAVINWRHLLFALITWTVLILSSLFWNLYYNHKETLKKARTEARSYWDLTTSFRHWGAKQGGVYVKVRDNIRPNPYLRVQERDVRTTDGVELTLVNPAWMVREVFEILKERQPVSARILNRIVSIKYLNPINKPDRWEESVLKRFNQGEKEVSEITSINGLPYLRVMKPFITEKPCLKCHGFQGYKVGDVRGGISIGVPLTPYYISERKTRLIMVISHLIIYLTGLTGIVLYLHRVGTRDKKLKESEWRFRTLSESTNDMEYWISNEKKIIFMSPSCERITGYSVDDFVKNPSLLWDIVHPGDRKVFDRHIDDFSSPRHDLKEFRIVRKDGSVRWVSHSCAPIIIEGRFLGRRGSNRDITEKKNLEDALLQSQKMESVGILSGGVAHNFNNMLTAIIGYSFLLRDALDPGSVKLKQYINNVLKSAEKARELTNSLLAFSRKQEIRPVPVSLNSIVKGCSGMLRQMIEADIELDIHYADSEYLVYADKIQLEQVILNLLTNARDAVKGKGRICIEVAPVLIDNEYASTQPDSAPGRYMTLMVSDTGVGMDKKELSHIFDPFYTTKEVGKGTGLGMAIVHGIVKQHNGFINVYSEKGTGTTFKIYLPEYKGEPGHMVETIVPDRNIERGKNELILLAEDEALVREYLYDFLETQGYRVIAAVDGEDALRKYHQHRDGIDLLILDVIMPGKNGKEVYETILRDNPDLKAVFLSGYTGDVLSLRGIYEEGLELLTKPVDLDRLMKKLREIIENR